MQTEPNQFQQLSDNAQLLLDRLSRQFSTVLFDINAAVELIEQGYAKGSDSSLNITASGMLHSQIS